MTALICGSMAYDTIMVFQDRFKNHILPDQIHMLSVAFNVDQMRREFGGCAGNIAYSLTMLGGVGLPMATVGKDFESYTGWMNLNHVPGTHIKIIEEAYTAQAFITTDLDDNQITAFHPGAMNLSHQVRVDEARDITLGMVSPDGRQGMTEHAEQFAAAGIPFIFDPGQALPMFDGDDLMKFIEQATWMAMNDYECKLVQERTKRPVQELVAHLDAVIVTLGGEGSRIHTTERTFEIPAAPVEKIVDPTGAGDAYRGGILYGLAQGLDWEKTGRIAAVAGAYAVEKAGTQNHHFDRDSFNARLKDTFNLTL
jgi:adenosine kinase